ncbi:MAG: HDOD domain-containing protein [Chitinivibrionales bacterium]|nr:HDOD domain-containing protein [Chitinivibrionales bacterium]MBD3396708.1 HDOD domain-containing protein [Chitinivibrionales bacterium]
MPQADIRETLERIEHLPTLPVVAQQVLTLLADRRSNMNQVAAVIARDQAISARVIRLVNSAFYGLRTSVSSIQHAIVILGLNSVKNLVLGVSVVTTFEDTARTSIFDREQFWMHTFATALGARRIAQELKRAEPEDYFLAGLLHDMGILAMDQFLHDTFVEILETTVDGENDLLAAEQQVLGTGHGDVGAFLGTKWRVPRFLIDTMRYHHTPERLPVESKVSRDKVAVVHAADARSREAGIGTFVENFMVSYHDATLQSLGIGESRLKEMFEEVKKEAGGLIREWGL